MPVKPRPPVDPRLLDALLPPRPTAETLPEAEAQLETPKTAPKPKR